MAADQLDAGALHHLLLANGVADEIVLGAGTFSDPDGFSLGVGSDPVEIRGAGPNATVLTSTSVSKAVLLDVASLNRAVTLRNLAVEVPASWLDGNTLTYGIRTRGLVEDVRVSSANPVTNGIEAGGTAKLRRVEVTAPQGRGVVAAYGGTHLTVEDSRLFGGTALSTGNYVTNTTLDVTRSILSASSGSSVGIALDSASATTTIGDSLLVVRSNGITPAAGIVAYRGSVIADHVTIVRAAGPVEATVGVWAYAPGDPSAQINLTNSIISGVHETGRRTGSGDAHSGTRRCCAPTTCCLRLSPPASGRARS